jgi:hypothetical protein
MADSALPEHKSVVKPKPPPIKLSDVYRRNMQKRYRRPGPREDFGVVSTVLLTLEVGAQRNPSNNRESL